MRSAAVGFQKQYAHATKSWQVLEAAATKQHNYKHLLPWI
jgi:hypothetical protein